ncbi:MAG TPA: protein kinase, partial [Gemmataceae bacterium]
DCDNPLFDSLPDSRATLALDWVPLVPSKAESLTITPPPRSDLMRSTFAGSRVVGEQVSMPQPGDQFFGFRLVEEIGHGTFARVFLAKQETLAGRDVVLKVTLRPTREPERIARLQHTNVVPVYSVHNATPVQIICMPYLGRRTLADVLTGYRKSRVAPGPSTRKAVATKNGSSVAGSRSRTGFRMPLEPAASPDASSSPSADPLVGNVDAVLQIVMQLADGLAHAHERGVLHLDLKPANVLVADTGEPMLLDFNLSYAAFEGSREVVGGTVPYMAPEQLLDMQTRGQGVVDARTDLYSLGVMAFELLAGKYPFPFTSRTLAEFDGLIAARKKGPPSLRELNPNVSPAVEAIVRKLLAPNPDDRYQHALDLRDDLERQLADRPLQFAADRSLPERLGKWRRRNPKALFAAMLVAALAAAGGAASFAVAETGRRQTREAEAKTAATHGGLESVRLGLVLRGEPAERERDMKKAVALLGEFGLPFDPNWQEKPAFQKVPPARRAALRGDLGELLLLVAQARWDDGKAGAGRKDAARDSLLLNQLAVGCFDAPPAFLARQKAELEAAMEDRPVEQVAAAEPVGPQAMFLDATQFLANGRYRSAIALLRKVVQSDPSHGAAQFFLAYCQHQLGDFEQSVERYEMARSLLKNDPRPAHYCGVARGFSMRVDRDAEAEDSFTQALAIDPNWGEAYRARAVARMEQAKWKEAEDDLAAALEHGASPAAVYSLRISIRDRLGDQTGAAADRAQLAKLKPEREIDFIARGYTLLPLDPRGALAEFQRALEKYPNSQCALRSQACILADYLHDERGAFKALERLTERYPEYALGHAAKAMILSRMGQREAAHHSADLAGQLSGDQNVTYRRACVYAMTSQKNEADRKTALDLLKKAFRAGFQDARKFETDRDLDSLRDLPEFQALL